MDSDSDEGHLDLAAHAHQRHAHGVRSILRLLDALLDLRGLGEGSPQKRRQKGHEGERQHDLDEREAVLPPLQTHGHGFAAEVAVTEEVGLAPVPVLPCSCPWPCPCRPSLPA
jgi:hypothetical protein